MNITVVGGMGKLGSEIAAHIAQFYPVRIADIKPGGEPTREATRDADIVIVMVDTPSLPSGAFDVSNVCAACGEIDLSRWRLIMVSCTVNPGDVEGAIRETLERCGKQAHIDFGLCYSPEFVRQGSVRTDFAYPDLVLAGCATALEEAALVEFYETVCQMAPTIMSVESAEIAKIGLNTFLTTKMAKANEIAWLCQHTPGADARDVLDAIGKDKRIGERLMHAGPPPGGPCLPRDNLAFAEAYNRAGLGVSISSSVDIWSQWQIEEMALLAHRAGQRVGVVGLSFKAWYSDPTESPGIALAKMLKAETYDPHIESTCKSLAELVGKVDVIVLAMPFEHVENLHNLDLNGKTFIDWWGAIADGLGAWKGCKYIRFGKGPERC